MDTVSRLTLSLRVMLLELGFMLVAFALFFFSFLFFFADHQPYPGILNNVQVLVSLELLVSLAIDVAMLRFTRRRLQRWNLSARTLSWVNGFNVVFITITLLPLVFVIVRGD